MMMSLSLSIFFLLVPPECNSTRGEVVSIIMMIKITIVNIHIVPTMSYAKNCSRYLTSYSVNPTQALVGRYCFTHFSDKGTEAQKR